jgi:hypothetical protein
MLAPYRKELPKARDSICTMPAKITQPIKQPGM